MLFQTSVRDGDQTRPLSTAQPMNTRTAERMGIPRR
jgi:hypothetical protein